jgi:Leu/Phe-tRNA-protein transferase
VIEYISPELINHESLRDSYYPRTDLTFYWSDHWDPDFYVALARAGFICISAEHPQVRTILIAELQQSYAVLDWENLHCSRNLRKLMASGRLEEDGVELRVVDASDRLLDQLARYHGEDSWLHSPYRSIVRQLAEGGDEQFSFHGIELWSTRQNELVAGELGYSIGSTYTSLSGFCSREDRRWRHFGTLQQIMLARALAEKGYAFWNMGHVSMPYKIALGARITPRAKFLERWCVARDTRPALALPTSA